MTRERRLSARGFLVARLTAARRRARVLIGGRGRRVLLLACGAALVLAGCSSRTTGATSFDSSNNTIQLNAIGSCDTTCTAFMRYRVVGTTGWTDAPAFTVGKVSDVPWSQTVVVWPGAQYEYQACGKEASWGDFVCAGPDGTPNTTHRFVAAAAPPLIQLSFDPFTNPASQHRTQVEPGSFSNGRRVVSAFQSGRFFGGGASDIGWATSTRGGNAWTQGVLPGITTLVGGPYAAVSDPSVAYDAAHHVWLISSLALSDPTRGAAVLVSRSRNGLRWSAPVTVAAAGSGQDLDKNWTVCDNTPSSPFFGHCYTEFDDFGHADQIKMSTSTDGGQTWSAPLDAAAGGLGFGGQPVVQPNGTVVVPTADLVFRSIFAFRSTDGGGSWSSAVTVSPVSWHPAAGALRDSPLPSAGVDAKGRVYVVWQDCSFRAGCASNDIVLSTSDDGINWSPPSRVPIDPVDSGADHFIPGLAVDPATSGSRARLALAYYYYPAADCTAATCQLDVGFIQSSDGGANWSAPSQLAGPMSLSWLPNTSQGVMVGDYIATPFVAGDAKPFFALAKPPSGGVFDEAIYTTAGQPGSPAQPLRPAQQAPGSTVPQAGHAPAAPLTAR